MNKKFIVVLATGTLLVTSIAAAAGCTKKADKAAPEIEVQALVANPETIESVDTEILLPMHMVNPVTNFTGDYFSDKATLLVEANGDENAKLTVVLAKSEKAKTTLTVDAKFDADSKTVSYENGTKKEIELDADGNAVSEKVIYEDGQGKFAFGVEEAIWDDNNEKIENMVFKFGIPEEHLEVEDVTTQKASSKKAAKKVTKATKTTKKTKKTKKPTKKPSKTSEKKTPQFTYGHSEYTYKDYTVYVNINKDNTAKISVNHTFKKGNDKYTYYFSFSGKINPNTGLFVYSNGSKEYIVEGPHVRQARMEYIQKASGYVTINGNSLTWFDGYGHYADDITFTKK